MPLAAESFLKKRNAPANRKTLLEKKLYSYINVHKYVCMYSHCFEGGRRSVARGWWQRLVRKTVSTTLWQRICASRWKARHNFMIFLSGFTDLYKLR